MKPGEKAGGKTLDSRIPGAGCGWADSPKSRAAGNQ